MSLVEDISALERSATRIKDWGETRLSNGKTLSQQLTIGGVPLWEIVAPSLAIHRLAKALSPGGYRVSLRERAAPHGHRLKRIAFDLISPWRSNALGCTEWPAPPVLMFLGFSQYIYRDTLEPVVESLISNRGAAPVVLHDRLPSRDTSPSQENFVHSIWHHWDLKTSLHARQLRCQLDASLNEIEAIKGWERIISFPDPALWLAMRDVISWLVTAFLPRLLTQAAVAQHIIQRHPPKLIISPDVADARTRIYTLLGRKAGIPTLEVQFGIYGPGDVEWRFFTADILAGMGAVTPLLMAGHGIPKERIVVTGSPRYDRFCTPAPPAETVRTRERLGIPNERPMVLFASAYYFFGAFQNPGVRTAMIRALFRAASRFPELTLVVKPHPAEDGRDLIRLAGHTPNIIFARKDEDIRPLTNACDAFATFFSNAALDALVMNKLTISLAFPGSYGSRFYLDGGATLAPTTPEEIEECLRHVVEGSHAPIIAGLEHARQRFLHDNVYQLDGMATERIRALAMRMANV